MPFRIDWLNLFVVQETLKSLLQHHSSEASVLERSAFFMVQLSHPYMTTGKTIALILRNGDVFNYPSTPPMLRQPGHRAGPAPVSVALGWGERQHWQELPQ